MVIKNLEAAADLEGFAGYITELSQSHEGHDHGHGEGGSIETVREDEHEGHRIVIRTTYRIEVDGEVLNVPLGLDNEGNVHCHSLPNYQFASAVDMVKQLIDSFPEDFKRKKASKKTSKASTSKKSSKKGQHDHGHDHSHHDHGAHKHSTKKGVK